MGQQSKLNDYYWLRYHLLLFKKYFWWFTGIGINFIFSSQVLQMLWWHLESACSRSYNICQGHEFSNPLVKINAQGIWPPYIPKTARRLQKWMKYDNLLSGVISDFICISYLGKLRNILILVLIYLYQSQLTFLRLCAWCRCSGLGDL